MYNDAEGKIYRLEEENERLVAEIKRLRKTLAAAEKVVEAAKAARLDDQDGPFFGVGQALAEYDNLKEEK